MKKKEKCLKEKMNFQKNLELKIEEFAKMLIIISV